MAKKSRPIYSSQKKRKSSLGRYAVLAVALLIVGGVAYNYLWNPSATATISYDPEDVVYDQPFRAVHEMKPGPKIPFLPVNQPQPKIVVPTNVHDFGSVGATAVVTHTFVIRNVGEAPLTISRAYTTCGCTTADVSARVIPPGKVALVKLRFDAGFHDVRGQTVKRGLIIENNDRTQWKAEVWTRASVRRS